jgi:glyoxylate reductase
VGVDHVNVADAASRGIPVGNTPGILNGATADLAFALLLAGGRRLFEGARYAHGPDYLKHDASILFGREVHGSTLGILGMGGIGTDVARRADGFDMRVLYHNRSRRPEAESATGASYVSFETLLEQSDYLVVTAPLTNETRGMIDAAALARMKSTATLVNVARGAIVDTDALADAIAAKRLFAAALDVTEPEPLPRDHPLLTMDRVTILPHLGSATEQTRQRMVEISVENLLRGLRGEPLLHQVG